MCISEEVKGAEIINKVTYRKTREVNAIWGSENKQLRHGKKRHMPLK